MKPRPASNVGNTSLASCLALGASTATQKSQLHPIMSQGVVSIKCLSRNIAAYQNQNTRAACAIASAQQTRRRGRVKRSAPPAAFALQPAARHRGHQGMRIRLCRLPLGIQDLDMQRPTTRTVRRSLKVRQRERNPYDPLPRWTHKKGKCSSTASDDYNDPDCQSNLPRPIHPRWGRLKNKSKPELPSDQRNQDG
jgi:hypothetical protein